MAVEEPPSSGRPTLVIVSGAGRSGTSTMAGALKYLGLTIPKPEVAANKANPRGYFEPRWVVDFHKRLLAQANVVNADAQPDCLEQVAKVADRPKVRDELREWLAGQIHHRQIVVKDPRAFMFGELWLAAARDLGINPVFLSMLRHPPEVCGSQGTYYLGNRSAAARRLRESGNVARWTNATLLNEQITRGRQRIFVRYADLLQDWRSTVAAVGTALGLEFNSSLDPDEHHRVDDFIDVKLHRVKVTWDDLDVPHELREQAESVWQILSDAHSDTSLDPVDEAAAARLDEIHAGYQQLHYHAAGIAHDRTEAAARKARRQGETDARERIRALEAEVTDLRAVVEAQEAAVTAAATVLDDAGSDDTGSDASESGQAVGGLANGTAEHARGALGRSALALARKARAFREG